MNGYKKCGIVDYFKEKIAPPIIIQYLYYLRRVEYCSNCPSLFNKVIGVYYRLKYRKLGIKCGFSIPPNVFGPGLSIPHYGTIIVNHNARVGNCCRLHACVNIGASAGDDNAPHLGDNCYIGPSAVIFGDIVLADNTTISANSTVNKSLDTPNCVIAGSPAKVVKENYANWLHFNSLTNSK
jgi:serine O-acetyltransferase